MATLNPAGALAALIAREGTNISWAALTHNAWIGCQEVSPACDLCYAREFTEARLNAAAAAAGRPQVVWGPGGARQRTSEANRRKPLRWNRVAAAAGTTLTVFCSSLSDWADNAVPDEWRDGLAEVIVATPNLIWMLLTKRIGNAATMLRRMFPDGVPANVRLGITVINQEEADRDVPKALSVKGGLGIRGLFVSVEPMLGPMDLTRWLAWIDLVICGGESGGSKARPMHPAWALELGDQCFRAKVAFHFKQWGEWAWTEVGPISFAGEPGPRVVKSVSIGNRKFAGDRLHQFDDGVLMVRVGTAKAGRVLAGREWLEEME